MSAVLSFIGTFLLSLFVALLAALQLADYFGANEEFILILMALPVFVTFTMVVFTIASALARRAYVLHWTALLLGFLTFAPLLLPVMIQAIANRSTNPFAVGIENTYILIELIVPALITVLVQWGLVLRRWRRSHGEDDLSRWPWAVTLTAGLIILNPFGLDILGQAVSFRASNWMRELARMIAMSGGGVLIAMALIEYYIRSRILHRRAHPPVASAAASG